MTTVSRHASGRAERRSLGGDSWGVDAASRKRRANELMREGLRHFDPAEPIPFFCECGRHRCYEAVWLTSAEFEKRRRDPAWRAVVRDHDEAPRGRLGRQGLYR